MFTEESRIYVAGADTLIGSGLIRKLQALGYTGVYEAEEPDHLKKSEVFDFFADYKPDYVFMAAGKSGGIQANIDYPADLISNNLHSSLHIIQAAHDNGVRKLLYLASSCSYPRQCSQPMHPEDLMTGPLEPTNEAYATGKLAGMALCRAYRKQYGFNAICGIPANTFGPGDDFSEENSHVIGALIRKMYNAKNNNAASVDVWGDGSPRREFIYVDDLADASIYVMNKYDEDKPINIGTGDEHSIRTLAASIRNIVKYEGLIRFDAGKPNGMPRKLLDTSALKSLGWRCKTSFSEALETTCSWYMDNIGRRAA